MTDYHIRPATENDIETILHLITQLAIYEKLEDEAIATCEDMQRYLFGDNPAAEVLIAESISDDVPAPLGFALFFGSFSTFLGKPGIYLEDLFVLEEHRGNGVGKALLQHLAALAIERGCGRLEWSVLDWNEPAINFYNKLGAVPMNGWTVNRLTGNTLSSLAEPAPA